MKRTLVISAALSLAMMAAAHAQVSVKLGVLNDRTASTPISPERGRSSPPAWQSRTSRPPRRASRSRSSAADHQNKPDVGAAIARQWYDRDGVDAILDVPTSSVALAVNQVTREKNKVFINSGAGTSDLTGAQCSPNTVHWTYDTWALANGTGSAMVKRGGDTWFFITADYAFGQALQHDTTAVVKKPAARSWARSRRPSRTRISRRSCCRRRPRRRR